MSEYNAQKAAFSIRHLLKDWAKEALRSRDHGVRSSKEVFLPGSTELSYESLPGPSWIRLLDVKPGAPGDIIRTSMRDVDLAQNPIFSALSYTWKEDPSFDSAIYSILKRATISTLKGEPTFEVRGADEPPKSTKTILCNGRPIKIYKNLYQALVELRRRQPGEYWIDAVCINQTNVEERAAQVKMMGHIYRVAKVVMVWLGAFTHRFALGLPSIQILVASGVDIPPLASAFIDGIVTVPADFPINAQALVNAYNTGLYFNLSQWFRRVWIVQEFCWASKVTFLADQYEVTAEVLSKGLELGAQFLWDLFFESEFGKKHSENPVIQCGQIWHPHSARTLQARDTFQTGDLWTLLQWLQTCKGRTATDPRDFVFAGISLIKPDLLSIDPNILMLHRISLSPSGPPRFARRCMYPQTIPWQGTKNIPRPSLAASDNNGATSTTDTSNLIPQGLWPGLRADYGVKTCEVLVNAAACLLTHSGTDELLSIAARPRRPELYSSKYFIAPGNELLMVELPSWAPAPGSWTYTVSSPLALRPPHTSDVGLKTQRHARISQDGRALFVDAIKLDKVNSLVLEKSSILDLDFEEFKQFLVSIRQLGSHDPAHFFPYLCRTLLGVGTADFQPTPEMSLHACRWLCQDLMTAFGGHLHMKRLEHFERLPRRWEYPETDDDGFAVWFAKYHEQTRRDGDDLVDLFQSFRDTFTGDYWPEHCRKQSARKQDMVFQSAALRKLADHPKYKAENQPEFKSFGVLNPPEDAKLHARLTKQSRTAMSWRKIFTTQNGLLGLGPRWMSQDDTVMLICGAPVPYAFTAIDDHLRSQEQYLRAEIDKNDEKYNQIFWRPAGGEHADEEKPDRGPIPKSWQGMFNRTLDLIGEKVSDRLFWQPGEDPKRSHVGKAEKASHLKPWHGLLDRRLNSVIDKVQSGRAKRLDRERIQLLQKLAKVSASQVPSHAWVLQGELFIDGIMQEEVARSDSMERITIV